MEFNLRLNTTSWPDGDVSNDSDSVEFLQRHLGSRYRALSESVILTVVYALVFTSGVVGNVCTGLIVFKRPYMRTSTNYYLCSLAVSDILTLVIGLPPELYSIWQSYPWVFGQPYCLFKTFLTEMTSSASVLTITAFTIERYVAICHPLRAQMLSSPPRVIKTTAVLWLVAAISASPYPFYTRTYHHLADPKTGLVLADSLICGVPFDWLPDARRVIQFTTFSLFALPITLITVLYVLIGITVRRSISSSTYSCSSSPATTTSESSRSRDERPERTPRTCLLPSKSAVSTERNGNVASLARRVRLRAIRATQSTIESPRRTTQQRKNVVEMLVAVVVAFVVCWAPFHAQRLMTIYIPMNQWTPTLLEIQSLLFYISGVLYFVSCTVNPILYNLMSNRYRRAFRETLCCCHGATATTSVVVSSALQCNAALSGSRRSSPLRVQQQQQQQQQLQQLQRKWPRRTVPFSTQRRAVIELTAVQPGCSVATVRQSKVDSDDSSQRLHHIRTASTRR